MHVHALYTYPIKSLRGVSLPACTLTSVGLAHDRRFLLQRLHPGTATPPANLHIGHLSTLCLFHVSFLPYASAPTSLLVRFMPDPSSGAPVRDIIVPLHPDTAQLERADVVMHNSACRGWALGEAYTAFFSECLGFPARLVWLGDALRPVLGNVPPSPPPSPSAAGILGAASSWLGYAATPGPAKKPDVGIGFADCAPLLVTTVPSLQAVQARLPDDETLDMTKFRPNVVVAPDEGEALHAWAEDYWAELLIDGTPVVLTANCGRCKSINVDYETGGDRPGDRQPLKALMRDRRIDGGYKYNPVFGRYGFVDGALPKEGATLRVGGEAEVRRRNEETTTFYWPGLSTGARGTVVEPVWF